MVSHELLRRDVRMLGEMLGGVIAELAGPEALELVEEIRHWARRRRRGVAGAESRLTECVKQLDERQIRVVTRAFSVFFDLSNLAEDRHRVRVLRRREAEQHPQPLGESIGAAIAQLHEAGFSATEVQQAIDELNIELVFTAHPSEAKRRSIRARLRRMRHDLQELDRGDLVPREQQRLEADLQAELASLWQTDFLRPWKPTVLQEVQRGLSIAPRLWEVVPLVYDALRRALREYYPDHEFRLPLFLRFGSWMGGDRDGNPNVTADVTAETLFWLRDTAIVLHMQACRKMIESMSLSTREAEVDEALIEALAGALERWPELRPAVEPISPFEVYRRWFVAIHWRLEQTRGSRVFDSPSPGAYYDGRELLADLELVRQSLLRHSGELLLESEVQPWLDLVRVFGLHLTRLDVRQDARRYQEIIAEIFAHVGIADDFRALDESERQELLTRTLPWEAPIDGESLSPLAQDTLQLFRLLRHTVESFGPHALGGHVISLTRQPSDVLTVLWLWRWAVAQQPSPRVQDHDLAIIPLFEKIDDLKRSAATLEAILTRPVYREHLQGQGNRQIVMVGYSDSTKDGGYLSACWGLYESQSRLHAVAEQQGIRLTFFHGRGGSLGRGGGPAARGILSLPPQALGGSLRLTEQGEVLAERYDDEHIAYRHLEQVTWATLLASALPAREARSEWLEVMESLARRSLAVYRELIEQPGFIAYFSLATPIDEIENLPIGSRPARRRGERTLSDLRAIPWVFAWTQNRCMIPAWYGLGTALLELHQREPAGWQTVRDMYRQWPFFQATIDNAALALAKADMYIAERYAELTDSAELREGIWNRIAAECERSRQAILNVTGEAQLLADTPWLQASIDVRNPYVDPLNLIQIELLQRSRTGQETASEEESNRLKDLLRLTIQGIAAGMRTTG